MEQRARRMRGRRDGGGEIRRSFCSGISRRPMIPRGEQAGAIKRVPRVGEASARAEDENNRPRLKPAADGDEVAGGAAGENPPAADGERIAPGMSAAVQSLEIRLESFLLGARWNVTSACYVHSKTADFL